LSVGDGLFVNFDELKLTAGFPVQLQVAASDGKPLRYSCKLIGYLPEHGILLTPARASGKLVRLVGGQKLVVRLMVANGMCLFSASVETLTTSPYPILHLSYPKNVSFKGVRNATRIDVRLPIKARNESDLEGVTLEGVVADISITGARMELTASIGSVGDEVNVSGRVNIGKLSCTLNIKAVIRSRIERSTREYDDKLPAVYGVEFIESDEDKLLVLYAYVYAAMSNESLFE